MSDRAPAIRAEGLLLAHGPHVALRDVTVEVPRACSVAVIGPNGSGKSSLLDAVSGLLAPAAGVLEVFGAPPGRAEVAYVLQRTDVPPHLPLTVREVVTMGRYRSTGLVGRLGRSGREAVDAALERVGMLDQEDRQLQDLSGGQRQRVLIAQGLASDAELLLLDEPMTGLDLPSMQRVLELVDEERDRGRTVVYSTHDLEEAARADLVLLLAGRLVAAGPPSRALSEEHLVDAYRGRLVDVAGLAVLDEPHHHGPHPHQEHERRGSGRGSR